MDRELMFDAITTTGIEMEFNLFEVELKHDTVGMHISYVKLPSKKKFTEILTDSITIREGQE